MEYCYKPQWTNGSFDSYRSLEKARLSGRERKYTDRDAVELILVDMVLCLAES
jgi:hypothetical protein